MNTRTDIQLLRDYAEGASEAAFSELVRRHLDFVYSVALRLVRDRQLAQDVSQSVFLALAQNARQLKDRAVLCGWLHRAARNLSANAIRSNVRRRAREQEAAAMNEILATEPEPIWDSIAPHLDAALSELNEPDRAALLLRYFQRRSARDIALTLGISSQAAQKRVNRAVERLRELFAKRGIVVGANGLMILITANAVQAAPSGLAATISAATLSAASIQTTTAITTAKVIAMTALQKVLIASIVLAALGIGIYHTRETAGLRKQIQALEQRQVPSVDPAKPQEPELNIAGNRPNPFSRQRRAAGPAQALTNSTAAVPFRSTQMYALLTNKVPKLTLEQVKPYLDAHGRSAASLLAAFRTTADPALLAEALQNFPNDPQVAFEAAILNTTSPEERRQWLDALKQAAPENSLPNYLSGLAHLTAGETAAAVQDLVAAAGKPQFQDYSQDRIQTDEEAYLAAGYPPGEAKLLANAFLASPQLTQIRELGQDLVNLAASYQQAGDQSSRQAALQMAVDLGRRFGDASTGAALVSQLVGITVERAALNVMDPAGFYDASGQTVQARLDQLAQQKEAIHALTAQADPLWQTLSDQDWLGYHNQVATSGEAAALQWVVRNYAHR